MANELIPPQVLEAEKSAHDWAAEARLNDLRHDLDFEQRIDAALEDVKIGDTIRVRVPERYRNPS